MKLYNQTEYYCWACDYARTSGEGNLARLFIKKNYELNNTIIFTANKIFKNKILGKVFSHKYVSPIIGIIFCWSFFLLKKKIIYINYLPLWNFFLFIFLPPKTILGPITGGANYNYNKQFIVRHIIFPYLYKISEFFLNLRETKKIFSTDLLKKYLSKNTVNKSSFNYVFNFYNPKIKKQKDIDFLIYYRQHSNKENFFPFKLIKKLISLNFKIHIVGNYLPNTSVVNHGFINNNKINDLLARTYFTISSNENIYGIFAMECFNNHVKIIVQKFKESSTIYFKDKFFFINFNSIYSLKNLKIYKEKI